MDIMKTKKLPMDFSYPVKCVDCKHRFEDELLKYCFCKIEQRPYYQKIGYDATTRECDGYEKENIF